MVKIKIRRINSSIKIPLLATEGSSGYDVYAMLDSKLIIKPLERQLITTGISFEIPQDFEIQIRSRSGLAWKNGVVVLNAPGTIDSDYRGELKIILINLSNENFTVTPNMRIAQIVCQKVEKIDWEDSDNLATSDRHDGGFGSTGNG